MESQTTQDLILTHSLLLGERLYLFARLRFLAAAGIAVGGLFATTWLVWSGWIFGSCARPPWFSPRTIWGSFSWSVRSGASVRARTEIAGS
jgi:hypothetical protein